MIATHPVLTTVFAGAIGIGFPCLIFGGASTCQVCDRHLFGPLLIRSPDARLLHGPFPVGDMDRPLSSLGYGMAPFQLGIWIGPFQVGDMGIEHALSICLDNCGVGVWLGTSSAAALMSCTPLCMFCCISRNSAFRGRSITLLMDHGTMSRFMFGLISHAR